MSQIFQKNDSLWVLNNEVIQELLKVDGHTVGVAMQTDADFILREKGEVGLGVVEKKIGDAGFPMKYDEIETMKHYPIGLRAISLLAVKNAFGFNAEDIKKMGMAAPKISLIIKFFMQYFLSAEKTFLEIPKMWRRHHSVGEIEPIEFDAKKRQAIVRIKKLDLHPIFCCFLTGYFSTVTKMIEKLAVFPVCKETKCTFSGDEYHEFVINW
jgi:hypothetical protein